MKISVVTGASSGMGREFARALDKKETVDELWLIARRKDRLEELAKEFKTKVRVLPLDLSDATSLDTYSELLQEVKPEVVTLCNVAGFGRFELFTDTELPVLLNMIDVNDKATVAMTYLTIPYMKRGSRIINLDSLGAFQPVPYELIYTATKAFILSFSRGLNVELEPKGIRVLAVCPGWVKTEFMDHAMTDKNGVTYINIWRTPEAVVKKALKDYKRGKDVSVLGLSEKVQVQLVKHLPHTFIMKTWMKQQGHANRPKED